jgi:hypothetical protein
MEIRKKKCENWKSRHMKTKQSSMKLSQIRRRIELCLREIILRFEMNLQNLLFSWQFNSYSYFKAITEVLSYWAVALLCNWVCMLVDTSTDIYWSYVQMAMYEQFRTPSLYFVYIVLSVVSVQVNVVCSYLLLVVLRKGPDLDNKSNLIWSNLI